MSHVSVPGTTDNLERAAAMSPVRPAAARAARSPRGRPPSRSGRPVTGRGPGADLGRCRRAGVAERARRADRRGRYGLAPALREMGAAGRRSGAGGGPSGLGGGVPAGPAGAGRRRGRRGFVAGHGRAAGAQRHRGPGSGPRRRRDRGGVARVPRGAAGNPTSPSSATGTRGLRTRWSATTGAAPGTSTSGTRASGTGGRTSPSPRGARSGITVRAGSDACSTRTASPPIPDGPPTSGCCGTSGPDLCSPDLYLTV